MAKKTIKEKTTIHGKSNTKLFKIWVQMIRRTEDPKADHFDCYGGRGIRVCEEWRNSFQAFYDWAMSHGYDESLTIDRIDVDGNYCPENCRWATMKEQARNTRKNVRLTYRGETMILTDWAVRTGMKITTLWARLFVYGWSVEEALETPVRKRRKK